MFLMKLPKQPHLTSEFRPAVGNKLNNIQLFFGSKSALKKKTCGDSDSDTPIRPLLCL